MSAAAYVAEQHNDVTFHVEPNFNGVARKRRGPGPRVDTTTGAVTVDASPPSPTRRNFIIEVTARNIGAPGEFKDSIRPQVHKAVTSVWLTPARLTIRPRPPGPANVSHGCFTVRAQFDDGVIGDLTFGHDITWTPALHVSSNGNLQIDSGDHPGDEFQITAQLAAALGDPRPACRGLQRRRCGSSGDRTSSSSRSAPSSRSCPGARASQTNRETEVPNVLFVPDGWPAAAQNDFVRLTTEMVGALRKTKLLDPYPRLTDAMCFWRMFVPSSVPTISVLSEVYTFQQGGRQCARRIAAAESPPGTGDFELAHLLYAVGCPCPGTRSPRERQQSCARTGRRPRSTFRPRGCRTRSSRNGSASGIRTFIDSVDSEFHMTVGAAPQANLHETRSLDLTDIFDGRRNLQSAIGAGKSGVALFGPSPAHELWSGTSARFDNMEYVVCFSTIPDARALAVRPVVMTTRDDLASWHVQAATGHPGLVLVADEGRLPADLWPVGRTLAHELGHKFGLGDEYGEHKEKLTGAPDYPNLQSESDIRDPVTNKLRGQAILWSWHRIAHAALIEQPIVPSGSNFEIPVRSGHANPFKAGQRVLLRQRSFLARFNPKPTVSSFEVEVDHTVSDDTIVVRLVGGATAAGLPPSHPAASCSVPWRLRRPSATPRIPTCS